MGILVSKNTRAIVQGVTGSQGSFKTKLMLDYGTKIVAGVTLGKGGDQVFGVPVYDTVEEGLQEHEAEASIIFVPAPFVADAALEAIDAGLKTIVIISEHVPVKDSILVLARARQSGAIVVGPNSPGVITPSECKLGIMPAQVFKPGAVGVASRSGTLAYEIASGLSVAGLGQSTCIGLGGDPVVGLNFVEVLKMFESDEDTKAVALVCEIGGNLEELAAEYISQSGYSKPVVAFVAGRVAPAEKKMGHAGAIIMGKSGTVQGKTEAFQAAGVGVAARPSDIARMLIALLEGKNISVSGQSET